MKYARQGINYEQVDDLGSGSSFTSTTNGCAVRSSNRNESINFVSLSLQEFFGKAWIFRYTNEILFSIKYQHRDQIITHEMEFNKQIGNFSYDLVSTTLKVARRVPYFPERITFYIIFKPRNISSDLVLQNLQVERKLYNKENLCLETQFQ
ncbi:uncharacterized protein LOC107370488 [Tetranychus urticae]|uniref:Uncharacterized protein n=1 Tax=Tetranychus urticae TaxID=32264 RepID=T1L602_TETUR|nr:uncharacterized protein LOC107370488 [Tetranychus urticae]